MDNSGTEYYILATYILSLLAVCWLLSYDHYFFTSNLHHGKCVPN